MHSEFHNYRDIFYLIVCAVLLIAQLTIIVFAFKSRSDGGVFFGLLLTTLSILFAFNYPFNIDIMTAWIGLFALFLYGLIFFFTLLARSYWAEDWEHTSIWQTVFIVTLIIGFIVFLFYIFV